MGDEHNPSNVVVELSGSLTWTAKGGFIEGVTFRRPKISSGTPPTNDLLVVEADGRVDVLNSVFDNDGCTGVVANVSGKNMRKGRWKSAVLKGGELGLDIQNGSVELIKGVIKGNKAGGVKCSGITSSISLLETKVEKNQGPGVHARERSHTKLNNCTFVNNRTIFKKENGCTSQCSGNNAFVKTVPSTSIPGFQMIQAEGKEEGKEATLESSTVARKPISP